MSRWATILFGVLAIAAVVFLAIWEPLTRSTREEAGDRTVLRLDPSKVRNIRIVSGDDVVEIKKKDAGWQLGPKTKDRADSAQVAKLLTAAGSLEYFDRIDASELKSNDNLSSYGLNKAKRQIEFEGDDNEILLLGKGGASEDRIYVRRKDARDIYLVNDEILRLAYDNPAGLRDRRLTDLSPEQVDRVILRRESGQIELVRDAQGWRIVKPLNAPADPKKTAEFLNRLLGLRIEDFVADDSGDLGIYGIAEGRNEITFYAEGKERHQTLRFGSISTDKPSFVNAQFTDRDTVYRLPAVGLELLDITPDSLRDRRLLVVDVDMVDKIRITGPEGEFTLRRAGEGWEWQQGQTIKPVAEASVLKMVQSLATTEVSAYTPMSGSPGNYGLEPPAGKIEFLSVLSENTPEARAGEQVIASLTIGKTDKDMVFCRTGEAPEIATVPASILTSLPLEPAPWTAANP